MIRRNILPRHPTNLLKATEHKDCRRNRYNVPVATLRMYYSSMTEERERLMIVLANVQRHSYRHIARVQGCDTRTVKKYVEHPELIGKRRQSSPHQGALNEYRD